MATLVTITVADIAGTISDGYTHIRLYRSLSKTEDFVEVTTPSTIIPLQSGISTYTFTDVSGTTFHWYATTFYDGTNETVLSTAFRAEYIDIKFDSITYPVEGTFTAKDYYIINRVRDFIGDRKELTRDYVSQTEGFDSISEDGKTHSLLNPRGWPLNIKVNELELTTASGMLVRDYQFLTYSGTINTTSTSTDTLDVWYYHFRFSDAEILEKYSSLLPPPPLTKDQVTTELAVVCTAIELLSGELRLNASVSGAEVDIFEEIRINPKGGIDTRLDDLKELNKLKDKLIAAILNSDTELFGVLID